MNHHRLAITSSILDKLGFDPYWDENGDWGGRTLTFSNGERFRIIEQEELEDDAYGYDTSGTAKFIGHHFWFAGFFALPPIQEDHDLFFLHEMYECIQKHYPTSLEEFTEKCKKLLMLSYLPKS